MAFVRTLDSSSVSIPYVHWLNLKTATFDQKWCHNWMNQVYSAVRFFDEYDQMFTAHLENRSHLELGTTFLWRLCCYTNRMAALTRIEMDCAKATQGLLVFIAEKHEEWDERTVTLVPEFFRKFWPISEDVKGLNRAGYCSAITRLEIKLYDQLEWEFEILTPWHFLHLPGGDLSKQGRTLFNLIIRWVTRTNLFSKHCIQLIVLATMWFSVHCSPARPGQYTRFRRCFDYPKAKLTACAHEILKGFFFSKEWDAYLRFYPDVVQKYKFFLKQYVVKYNGSDVDSN